MTLNAGDKVSNSLLQWKQWTQQSKTLSNPEALQTPQPTTPASPRPRCRPAAVTMAALMANRVLVNNKVSGISHMRCPGYGPGVLSVPRSSERLLQHCHSS